MPANPMPGTSSIWRTEGLLSDHYVRFRLPDSVCFPADDRIDALAAYVSNLFGKHGRALASASEEDCERLVIEPILIRLGFGLGNRKSIPHAAGVLKPDYLLYPTVEDANAALETADYYAACIGLAEAKPWKRNLSSADSPSAARPRSPHQQIRDYLSETSSQSWGILTNGAQWRLYWKGGRASAYFEFDLEAAVAAGPEDERRAAIGTFLALFGRDAFIKRDGDQCELDLIRKDSARFRAQIERSLRRQVFDAIELLAQGFLSYPANRLRASDLPAIYDNSLILLYRILFVLNAEARGLLPTNPTSVRERRYYYAYGLDAIRSKLSEPTSALIFGEPGQFQLYERLRGLFALINGQLDTADGIDRNHDLGIPRYNGGLFDPVRYEFLATKQVSDSALSTALGRLMFGDEAGEKVAFDYESLGERHLGSIYEGLLEHELAMGEDGRVRLISDRGERRDTGAYYTPEDWVEYIVSATLRPLLTRCQAVCDDAGAAPDSFAAAVLGLKICDPAMGSGHFLVEATMHLAEAIGSHATTAQRPILADNGLPLSDAEGEPILTEEATIAYWRRRVVESCIFGVDMNPLAVELAKLSLWLKTVDRVPLNFLDHHIRCGNSLVGTTIDALPSFPTPRKSKSRTAGQLPLAFTGDLTLAIRDAIADIARIEAIPTDTQEASKQKEQLWRDVSDRIMPRFRQALDLWLAPWVGGELSWVEFVSQFDNADSTETLRARCADVLDPLRAFHWELEFPEVHFNPGNGRKESPGFDAVIGNPPWDRIKLQQNEFFAARVPEIAKAQRAADRRELIEGLPTTHPEVWTAYAAARRRAESTLRYVQRSGFYPLMGRGDTNLYAIFAERALGLVNAHGRVGLLTPSGIATDFTTREFFQKLVVERRLSELWDFENRRGVFEDVHRSFKFSIVEFTGAREHADEIRAGFYLHAVADMDDEERQIALTPDDIALFNPNTLTCPVFRRRSEVAIGRKLYHAAPVLIDRSNGAEKNPWGAGFQRMFDMTNDSAIFKTRKELEDLGYWLGAGNVFTRGSSRYRPLYEGKMVQLYDHRAASVTINLDNVHRPAQELPTTFAQHSDPDFSPEPQYWAPESDVLSIGSAKRGWQLGYKDVTSPTNVRTMIASPIPWTAVGNTICLIDWQEGFSGVCLAANLCSFVLDFAARQKVGGQHLNFFIVEQLPVLPPDRYDGEIGGVSIRQFIGSRMLELCYTAGDMAGFAKDMGHSGPPFVWDEERRFHLRCQLDAVFFLLYGLDVHDAGAVLETFPIIKQQDERQYGGRFRTSDLIVGYMKAYAAGNMDAWVKG